MIKWTSICIILYSSVHYVNIYTKHRAFAGSFNFFVFIKKTVVESYVLFQEAYDDYSPLNDGFSVSKVVILMLQTRNMKNLKKYYELLKPGETVDTRNYQQKLTNWTICCLIIGQNTERGNTKSFFFMTMLYHIWKNWFATRLKPSTGKFYPMKPTHQTWFLLIIICLHWWVTCWAAL